MDKSDSSGSVAASLTYTIEQFQTTSLPLYRVVDWSGTHSLGNFQHRTSVSTDQGSGRGSSFSLEHGSARDYESAWVEVTTSSLDAADDDLEFVLDTSEEFTSNPEQSHYRAGCTAVSITHPSLSWSLSVDSQVFQFIGVTSGTCAVLQAIFPTFLLRLRVRRVAVPTIQLARIFDTSSYIEGYLNAAP